MKSKSGKEHCRNKDSGQQGLVNFRPEVAQATDSTILVVFVFRTHFPSQGHQNPAYLYILKCIEERLEGEDI